MKKLKITTMKPMPDRANALIAEMGEDNVEGYLFHASLASSLMQTGKWSVEECTKMAGDLAEDIIKNRAEWGRNGAVSGYIEAAPNTFIGIFFSTCSVSMPLPSKEDVLNWLVMNEIIIVSIIRAASKSTADTLIKTEISGSC